MPDEDTPPPSPPALDDVQADDGEPVPPPASGSVMPLTKEAIEKYLRSLILCLRAICFYSFHFYCSCVFLFALPFPATPKQILLISLPLHACP